MIFKDCMIPEENILPKAKGLKTILSCLNYARYGVACGALGSAIACYQIAEAFARQRNVFEKPIASYQLIQEKLVRMVFEITKAQLLTYHLGRLLDQNKARHTQISMVKLNNVREAMKIARMARDILGARGILADHHIIRHLCDLEAVSTLEGTENIHTLESVHRTASVEKPKEDLIFSAIISSLRKFHPLERQSVISLKRLSGFMNRSRPTER
jgi:glutaryl-CoA dehydrogenase